MTQSELPEHSYFESCEMSDEVGLKVIDSDEGDRTAKGVDVSRLVCDAEQVPVVVSSESNSSIESDLSGETDTSEAPLSIESANPDSVAPDEAVEQSLARGSSFRRFHIKRSSRWMFIAIAFIVVILHSGAFFEFARFANVLIPPAIGGLLAKAESTSSPKRAIRHLRQQFHAWLALDQRNSDDYLIEMLEVADALDFQKLLKSPEWKERGFRVADPLPDIAKSFTKLSARSQRAAKLVCLEKLDEHDDIYRDPLNHGSHAELSYLAVLLEQDGAKELWKHMYWLSMPYSGYKTYYSPGIVDYVLGIEGFDQFEPSSVQWFRGGKWSAQTLFRGLVDFDVKVSPSPWTGVPALPSYLSTKDLASKLKWRCAGFAQPSYDAYSRWFLKYDAFYLEFSGGRLSLVDTPLTRE